MNWIDLTILGIVTFSIFLGFWRGFSKEAISLLSWIAAGAIALKFSTPVSEIFHDTISQTGLRYILAFVLLVTATLVAAFFLKITFARYLESGELSQIDRCLGLTFGGARGAFIVATLVYVLQATPYPNSLDWQQSKLMPHFEKTSALFMSFMPAAPDFLTSKERLRTRMLNPEEQLAVQED